MELTNATDNFITLMPDKGGQNYKELKFLEIQFT